jgi:hypothetical protein
VSGVLFNTSATGGYLTDRPPGPETEEDLEAIVQTMVATLTGLPGNLVRPRWQPTPPTQPPVDVTWASIGVLRQEVDDFPQITHDGALTLAGSNGQGADRMQRHSTLTFLVTFYGPLAANCAARMRDALYIQQQMELSKPLKLREVRDLAVMPEIINNQWVSRVDLEVDFRLQIDRVYPVLNLEGADIVLNNDQGDPPTTVIVRP